MMRFREIDDFGKTAWMSEGDAYVIAQREDGKFLLLKMDGGNTLHVGDTREECERVANTL